MNLYCFTIVFHTSYVSIHYIYGIFFSKTLTVVLVSFVSGVLKAPMLLVGVSHFWWLLKPIQSPTALPAGEIRLQARDLQDFHHQHRPSTNNF